EEQRQEVLRKESLIGAIVCSEQSRFQRTPRRVRTEQRFPTELGTTHLRPLMFQPLVPRRHRAEQTAWCVGHRIAWRVGTATQGGSGSLRIRGVIAYVPPLGHSGGQTSADRHRISLDNRAARQGNPRVPLVCPPEWPSG